MFKIILFATDNSAHSDKALPQVIDLAKSNNSKVIVLNTYYIPKNLRTNNDSEQHYANLDKMEKNLIDYGNKIVNHVKEKLEEQNINVKAIVVNGPAGITIVNKAKEENCDLIIVGTRGMGNIQNPLISSVSNFVIHNAKCSVLLVH